MMQLQQHLPFTVLKLKIERDPKAPRVATALTVHGIETFTGIVFTCSSTNMPVATALTVHGIETVNICQVFGIYFFGCNSTYRSRY